MLIVNTRLEKHATISKQVILFQGPNLELPTNCHILHFASLQEAKKIILKLIILLLFLCYMKILLLYST